MFKHLYLLIAININWDKGLSRDSDQTRRILFHLTVGAIDGLLTLDPDLCVLNQSSLYTILSANNSDSSVLTRIIAPSRKIRYFCLCFRLTFICWLWFTRGCYPTWWALHMLYIRTVYGGQSFTVVTIFRKQKRAQNSTFTLSHFTCNYDDPYRNRLYIHCYIHLTKYTIRTKCNKWLYN